MTCPLLCYLKHLLHQIDVVSPIMALGWVAFLLFAGCSAVQEKTQAFNVSERCMMDTNTFLWEINQDRPEEYAVLSKCLKAFFMLLCNHLFICSKAVKVLDNLNYRSQLFSS